MSYNVSNHFPRIFIKPFLKLNHPTITIPTIIIRLLIVKLFNLHMSNIFGDENI